MTFPDEVVTEAKLRLSTSPAAPSASSRWTTVETTRARPRSVRRVCGRCRQPLTRQRRTGIVGIGVTGKPFIFAVGADLSGDRSRRRLQHHRRVRQARLRRLPSTRRAFVPTFAFVNGAAMGGGLELALQCNYRTLDASAAGLSLPEVFLGLVPGWGRAWLLPHLIGPQRALDVIINNSMNQNKQLRPAQAAELGVVDVVFEPADFLEQSLAWADDVISGRHALNVPAADRRESWDQVVADTGAGVDAGSTGPPQLHTGPWILSRLPRPQRAPTMLSLPKTPL